MPQRGPVSSLLWLSMAQNEQACGSRVTPFAPPFHDEHHLTGGEDHTPRQGNIPTAHVAHSLSPETRGPDPRWLCPTWLPPHGKALDEPPSLTSPTCRRGTSTPIFPGL